LSYPIDLSLYHPFINPIVNPADILPVNGIPKLVIANEEAVAAAGPLSELPTLIPGICIIIAFERVVIAPSYTCCSLFQFMMAICCCCRYANPARNNPNITATNLITFFIA
jgi:hypothetical protein